MPGGVERSQYWPGEPQPTLVDCALRAISPNGKTARRARVELYRTLSVQSNQNLTFGTISFLQREILKATEIDRVKNAFEVIDDLVDQTVISENPTVVTVTESYRQVIQDILDQDERIRALKHAQKFMKTPYLELSQRLVPKLIERLDEGNPQASFEYVSSRKVTPAVAPAAISRPSVSPEDLKRIIEEGKKSFKTQHNVATIENDSWAAWVESMNKLIDEKDSSDEEHVDQLLTVFRQQPIGVMTDYLWTKNLTGMSMADVEALPYPLSPYDATRITKFFDAIKGHDLNDKRALLTTVGEVITHHFNLYEDDYEPRPLTNWAFLRNIDAWRQHFWYTMLFDTDQRSLHTALNFFNSLDSRDRTFLMTHFPKVANARPIFQTSGVDQFNPFFVRAMGDFRKEHSRFVGAYFVHEDDIWQQEYEATYLPRLEHLLSELGLLGELQSVLTLIKEKGEYINLEERISNAEVRVARIADLYANFMPKLANETFLMADEITTETQTMWHNALARGLYALPLHEGVEVIHFTKRSIPYRMGITRLYINRNSTGSEWGLNVRYDFIDPRQTGDPLFVIGIIDHGGDFSLSTPIEEYVPGIAALLGRMAVLSTIDITHLHEKERMIERTAIHPQTPDADQSTSKDQRIRYTQIPRIRSAVRRQTEVMLQEAVTPKVRMDPRRIGTHKMSLFGIRDYEQALEEYRITGNEDVLNEARRKMRKPNPQKLEIWPPDVAKTTYMDPVTKDIVYGNTWVTEFTKPKLTPEQELEIVLWQRNYRPLNTATSALATLSEFDHLLS